MRDALGLIFDLDGVLILSRDCHRRAFEEVLSDFGIHDFNYDQYAGWRTSEVFHSVFGAHPEAKVTIEKIAECSTRKSARARELLAAEAPIAPMCVSVLQACSKRYKMALASSGSRPSVQAFLDLSGTAPLFQSVLSGDDVIKAKPDPELFTRSIEALQLPAFRCIVIEDAPAGVQAARLAGTRAIGMGLENEQELRQAGAVLVVGSLSELAKVLNL